MRPLFKVWTVALALTIGFLKPSTATADGFDVGYEDAQGRPIIKLKEGEYTTGRARMCGLKVTLSSDLDLAVVSEIDDPLIGTRCQGTMTRMLTRLEGKSTYEWRGKNIRTVLIVLKRTTFLYVTFDLKTGDIIRGPFENEWVQF